EGTTVAYERMSLQGPIVVVGDRSDPELVAALGARAGAPAVETTWADAAKTVLGSWPTAVLLNETTEAVLSGTLDDVCVAIETIREPYLPVLARAGRRMPPVLAGALPVSVEAGPAAIVARLSSALRVRALHAAAFRRGALLKSNGGSIP